VFKSPTEFHSQSFNTCIAPLVRQAVAGETGICVVGGSSSFDFNNFLLSHKGMNGFLCEAANLALQYIHKEENTTSKSKSLTFSWFRMDCNEKETMWDVCDTHPKELVLRELGNGRGLAAYDLAEVEVTNGAEVDAIIKAVLENFRTANHSTGDAHTILQLKMSPRHVQKHSTRTGAGKLLDPPGTGRIYFVLLSNLSSQKQLMASDGNIGRFPWVEKVPMIMDWLESKRATPPFKSSRLLLFLRDALYGRQPSSLILLLNPIAEYLQLNYSWLQLSQRLCKDSLYNHHQVTTLIGPALGGGSASSPNSLDSPYSRTADNAGFNGVSSPKSTSDVSMNSARDRYAKTKRVASGSSTPRDPQEMVREFVEVRNAVFSGETENFEDSLNVIGNRTTVSKLPQPPPPPPKQLTQQPQTVKQRRDSATYDDSNPFFSGFDNGSEHGDKSVAEEMKYGAEYDPSVDHKLDVTQLEISSVAGTALNEATSILSQINSELGARQSQTTYQRRLGSSSAKLSIVPAPMEPLSVRSAAGERFASGRLSPACQGQYSVQTANTGILGGASRYNETEMILAASLDVTKRECDVLRQKLLESNEKLALCQEAYDSFVAQLRDEGSLLIKREQERFKKCLQDLRDYEVYKKVMEAAMIRMQQEVSNLAEENSLLRNSKSSIEHVMRKQKTTVFKSAKEVQKGSGRIHDLEQLASRLETEVRARECVIV
jgi:hypothetical protein